MKTARERGDRESESLALSVRRHAMRIETRAAIVHKPIIICDRCNGTGKRAKMKNHRPHCACIGCLPCMKCQGKGEL